LKLLIVDDSQTILSTLSAKAEKGGIFSPVTAGTYAETKSILENSDEKFFAAIVDLMLPDCNDGEAVDLVLNYNIPTIVLTGSFNKELRESIINKPIVDFLFKSSSIEIESAVEMAEEMVSFSRCKALVVDSSRTKAKYIGMFFSELLFDVLEVESTEDAIVALRNSEDIKIVTINNEREDIQGPQLIRMIRQDPLIKRNRHNKSVIIFGVSVNADDYLRSTFIKSGANDLLSLPLSKEEFNSKVFNQMKLIKAIDGLKDKNRQLEETVRILGEYNKAVDAGGSVSKSDLEGNITYANETFCEMTGYTQEELIGQPHSIFRHPSIPKAVFKEMWENIQAGKIWKGVLKNLRKDKSEIYVNCTIVPIIDYEGEIIEYVAIRQNITELVNSREELGKQFQTDSLTSLGNRIKLQKDSDNDQKKTLALFDIDGFKEINSVFGQECGDKVLKEIGDRLFEYFPVPAFSTYRTNANEFAVLFQNSDITEINFNRMVVGFLEKINGSPLVCGKDEVDIQITGALAEDEDDILNKADIALKTAKNSRVNFYEYNENSIKRTEEYRKNIVWGKIIKEAIFKGDVLPYFQPVVSNSTGKTNNYEALMRIRVNDNIITPDHFLDVAKRSKSYLQLTKIMVNKCFRIFEKSGIKFNINLSVEDLTDPDTCLFLEEIIDSYGMGNKVTFEIVESEGIGNFEEVGRFINRIKKKGCMIAIDDFGSGYSNFEYLMRLNADYIKIDGYIISNILEDQGAKAITESIVAFARKNNMKTIAEYVSSKEIYEKVKELGIDFSQGYYFGKPAPWEDFVDDFLKDEINKLI